MGTARAQEIVKSAKTVAEACRANASVRPKASKAKPDRWRLTSDVPLLAKLIWMATFWTDVRDLYYTLLETNSLALLSIIYPFCAEVRSPQVGPTGRSFIGNGGI